MRRLLSLTMIACALGLAPAVSLATPSILPGFRSPSGNIKCLYQPVAPAFLYCTIGAASYAKKLIAYCAAAPRGVDWAGFTLGKKSKGSIACSGGTLYEPSKQHPRYVTLPYGKTWRHSVFACTSRATGVTCRNPSGHGVFISRESYHVY